MTKKKFSQKKTTSLRLQEKAVSKTINPQLRDLCIWILLLVITLITYMPALNGQRIWDDDDHITAPQLRSIDGLVKIWIQPGATKQYYPLTHSVFWLQYHLWGDSTVGYHLFTLLMHVLSALLLIKILRFLEIPLPWLIGFVFVLHPVQVESVAWISELKNTLSGVFYFSSILMYLKFDKNGNRKNYLFALLFFVLGLFSKSVIAVMPVSLLAILWWKRGSAAVKNSMVAILPFFIMGIASGLFTAWIEHTYIGAKGGEFNFTIIERCLIAGRTFWFYLLKSVLPLNLTFVYPRWNVDQTVWWQYIFPLAAIVLTLVAWQMRKRWRAPFAFVISFSSTIFPVMGFLNVYPFRYSFVADHFQYLAIIIPVIVCVVGINFLFKKLSVNYQKIAIPALFVLIIPSLAAASSVQSRMYSDEETVYRTTIKKNASCCMAYNNLGVICAATDRAQEAANYYQTAIKYNPRYYEAYNNLGILFTKNGQLDKAVFYYKKTLSINNDYADGHFNLGCVLMLSGHADEAVNHFQKALELKDDYEIRSHLADALLQVNRIDDAIAQYLIVLDKKPTLEQVRYNLAAAYEKKSRIGDAIDCYKHILNSNPLMAPALRGLDSLLELSGTAKEALVYFRKALEIDPDNIMFLYNYVGALKRQGMFSDAVPVLKHILDLAKAADQKDAIVEIENELQLCEKENDSKTSDPGNPLFLK